jgi:hypothetical protein
LRRNHRLGLRREAKRHAALGSRSAAQEAVSLLRSASAVRIFAISIVGVNARPDVTFADFDCRFMRMKLDGAGNKVWEWLKRFLEHRYLPVILAVGAILVMLPALKIGLMMDDLPQRAVELRPSRLPPRMHETGNPADSGSFSTVLCDLFGFSRNPQCVALMKNYGALPWWTPDDLKISLCRPVTALTHWLDYRLFPDTPALMHAHNLAWFAAVVFLITIVYRKLMGTGRAAGLAALLFLLDGDTYFPVAFVANRGFFLALFFGLLCLYEHHQWRSTKSRSGLVLSMLFLALSLFAEESGASTFAFILAYALALESGSFRDRALTVLPSVLVIIVWRIIYTFSGYGLSHVGIYIDPAQEPLRFARELIPRAMVLLGGQLTGVPPEFLFAVKPSLHLIIIALYGMFVVAALVVFLPWVRRDKVAAFWLAVMILAAIPEAVLVPLSKNFGFIAVGAYGLIASFVASLFTRPIRLPEWLGYRILVWIACVLLILVHGPGAVAKRIAVVKADSFLFAWANHSPGDWPNIENENVIVVNAPCSLVLAYVPSYKAYYHQLLPKTVRTLVPGCTGFDVQRTDDKTLVVQSQGPNIFSCDDVGPIHIAYALSAFNLVGAEPGCEKGDRYNLGGLTVEVLESDASDLPSRVAFRFNTSLDSPDFRWFWFDWRTFSREPFKIPAIGQRVTLSGPPQRRLH